jgi:hypothetical protein
MKPDRNCGSGDGGEIATLHAEVLEVSLASDRSRDDMLEFKDSDAQVLWSLAIAASVREPSANLLVKIRGYVDAHAREARAWRLCKVYLARVFRTVS